MWQMYVIHMHIIDIYQCLTYDHTRLFLAAKHVKQCDAFAMMNHPKKT